MDSLTVDEQQVLEEAKRHKYLLASGQRLEVLWRWRAWCRENRVSCVVARRGARQATIEVDRAQVSKVNAADMEREAARIVSESTACHGVSEQSQRDRS